MFLDFYKLEEQPFGVTPDPRYLFLSASHREALASLFYGVKAGRGLLALIAPPGMGKTTLLFHFLEHLRHSARTAYLFQTQCDSLGLLRYLLGDLRVDGRGQDFVAMHGKLNELLLQEAKRGRRFVVVIDESQNLEDSVLETARLLSDFETPREKLLQIVFAGQSELAEKLAKPELAQLRQRIAILSRLEPLCPSDVARYVEHRLCVAGYKGGPLFTTAAMDSIAACTQGIPRNINNVCFGALSLGCALRIKEIGAELIAEVAADLDISPVSHERNRKLLPVVLPVSLGPVTSTIEPECVVGRGLGEKPQFDEQNEYARSKSAIGEPVDHSYQPLPNESRSTVAPHEGLGGGTLEVELVGLDLCEELAGTLAVLKAVANQSLLQAQSAPNSIDSPQTGPQAEVANESVNPDFRSARQQSSEARPECGDGESTQSLCSVDASVSNLSNEASTLGSECERRAEPKWRSGKRMAFLRPAVAAGLIVAFIAATSFRQDITIAMAGFASYFNDVKIKADEAYLSADQLLPEKTTGAANRNIATGNSGSAPTTQEISARVSRTAFSDQGSQSAPRPIIKSVKSGPDVRTTVVIVRPGDDLRQICLRHFGSYNERLLKRVSALNHELTDPDRIDIGQKIVLPQVGESRSNASPPVGSTP